MFKRKQQRPFKGELHYDVSSIIPMRFFFFYFRQSCEALFLANCLLRDRLSALFKHTCKQTHSFLLNPTCVHRVGDALLVAFVCVHYKLYMAVHLFMHLIAFLGFHTSVLVLLSCLSSLLTLLLLPVFSFFLLFLFLFPLQTSV